MVIKSCTISRSGERPLLVEHQQFAAIDCGVVLEPLETKTGQTVAVGENQRLDFSAPDGIHQFQKPLALEVQPAAHLLDELDVRQAFRHNKLFQHSTLVGKVWLLCRARDATIGHLASGLGKPVPQPD